MSGENLTFGICAHVDAGKTTLSEALMFKCGAIRKAGRVDHRDAFLDTYELEKDRGITIFSKQARFATEDRNITILDTPGHADFSAEMERVLHVLDYALLLISAPDMITGQVRTLWRLLSHYKVPVFIFVNKMDQDGTDKDTITGVLKEKLSEGCVVFNGDKPENFETDEIQESIAVLDDSLMESYLEEGKPVSAEALPELISERKLIPVYFGSALKMEGVEALIQGINSLTLLKDHPGDFGARVYKISRDGSKRLTWMKITGGSLKIRSEINGEKVVEIRLYSGSKHEAVQEAAAGTICAVAGLSSTFAGAGLGAEKDSAEGLLQPLERCRVILPEGKDTVKALDELKTLEEEEPMLHVSYDEETRDITAEIMGDVQIEIIKELVNERFGYRIEFGPPEIVYKETIVSEAEGVGHYEPLRHYAEVHLLLEPGERGSGIVFENKCPRDYLTENYQKLIMTHLKERKFKGILTCSEITDMRISLIAGKSHEKHTEGGDFRQATYRAVRQGLMMAGMKLLEPVMNFTLEVPSSSVGRAMTDLSAMSAVSSPPELSHDSTVSVLRGTIPASEIGDYARTVTAYTAGEGHFTATFKEYAPCHNAEEVIEAKAYDPELDTRNTGSSVFCMHGAGTIVPWDKVRDYMQVDTGWKKNDPETHEVSVPVRRREKTDEGEKTFKERERDRRAADAELMEIFERTYGPIKTRTVNSDEPEYYPDIPEKEKGPLGGDPKYNEKKKSAAEVKNYLLVDGYNIIFAWPELKDLSNKDLKAARDKLMDILSNYAGYTRENLILVYDAYKVNGGKERIYRYNNIDVVYTREAETADLYIEKAAHELGKKHNVTVATSDNVEQVIIFGAGAVRMSALNFLHRVKDVEAEISGLL
ncbi:MAG: NYN domain-containing protein [Lachnospiraceae bacterium]|nr:NYN domain-containing protein [Lachnospiraceae bacterium]